MLRAGATETGVIDGPGCLPAAVNLDGYSSLLLEAAIRVAQGEAERVPWYLAQQALLYIAVHDPGVIQDRRMPRTNRAYWRLISFLNGELDVSSDREFAISAVLSRRSFLSKDQAVELVGRLLTAERFRSAV